MTKSNAYERSVDLSGYDEQMPVCVWRCGQSQRRSFEIGGNYCIISANCI